MTHNSTTASILDVYAARGKRDFDSQLSLSCYSHHTLGQLRSGNRREHLREEYVFELCHTELRLLYQIAKLQ